MKGENCKLKFGGKNIGSVSDWGFCGDSFLDPKGSVSFSGTFESPSYGNVLFDVFKEQQTQTIKLHLDDYMHYEMNGVVKSPEILPNGSVTLMILGDIVRVVYTTIKKQFRMHPQGRNPICWTIERMFG